MKIFQNKKIVVAVAVIAVLVIGLSVGLGVYYGVFYYGKFVSYSAHQREVLQMRAANVDLSPTGLPLKREISPDMPLNLVTYYGDADGVEKLWQAMPEYMREISVLLIIPGNILKPNNSASLEKLERTADECERLKVPFSIQNINGETHAEWLIPLKYLEDRFLEMEYCYGLSAAELYNAPVWRGGLDGDFSDYMADCIRLAAKHGEFMFWTDTNKFGKNGNLIDWIENNEYLYTTMKENAPSVIMQNKESYGDASTYSLMYGLYLSGLIGGWGVATDFWHWQVSDFKSVFGEYDKDITFEWERILNYPEAMQAASLLFVASAGGFCFKNEAQFYSTAAAGERTAGYQYAMLPFYNKLRSGDIEIPTREQLLKEAKFAVVGGSNYSAIDYDLSQSTLYPSTGKYGIIPLLPANLRPTERKIFDDNNIALIEEKMSEDILADFKDDVKGNTFCSFAVDTWYYVNNSENVNLPKYAEFALKTAPQISVKLTSEPHFSATLRENDGKLSVYMNNYRTDVRELCNTTTEEPEDIEAFIAEWFGLDENGNPKRVTDTEKRTTTIVVRLNDGGIMPEIVFAPTDEYGRPFEHSEEFDAESGELTITVRHNGAVSFDIMLGDVGGEYDVIKNPVQNRTVQTYDADYSKLKDVLDDYEVINADRVNYQERSFYEYRKCVEELKIGAEAKILSSEAFEKAVTKAQEAKKLLIDASSATQAIRSFEISGASNGKLKKFDILQRSLYSPTKYVSGKENQLILRDPYRKGSYNKKLYKSKTKEIDNALNSFLKAK